MRQRRDGGGHLNTVLALAQILLFEFEFSAFEHGLVKNSTFTEPDLTQRRSNRLRIKFAHAGKIHRSNGGALLHDHYYDVVLGLYTHIDKEARTVQATNRLGGLILREGLPNLHWHIAENSTGVGALYALYADVFHNKGCEGLRHGKGRNQQCTH